VAIGSRGFIPRFAAAAAPMILLCPTPASGQAVIKVDDSTFFRFGVLLQAWADWQKMPDTSGTGSAMTGTQQNLYLRRARLFGPG